MEATTVLVFMSGPMLMVIAAFILAIYLGLEGIGAEIRSGLANLGVELARAWALQNVAATVPASVDPTGWVLRVEGMGGVTKFAMKQQVRPGPYRLAMIPMTRVRVTGA